MRVTVIDRRQVLSAAAATVAATAVPLPSPAVAEEMIGADWWDDVEAKSMLRAARMKLSYLFVMFFSVLGLAAVSLPESWLASSERYVLGAAF
jgi:hypothetical protein